MYWRWWKAHANFTERLSTLVKEPFALLKSSRFAPRDNYKVSTIYWYFTIALESLSDGPLGDPAVGGDGHQHLAALIARTSLLFDPLELPDRASVFARRLTASNARITNLLILHVVLWPSTTTVLSVTWWSERQTMTHLYCAKFTLQAKYIYINTWINVGETFL